MVKEYVSFSDQVKIINDFPAPRSPKGYPHFRKFYLNGILSSFQEASPGQEEIQASYNAVLMQALREKAPTYYVTDEMELAASNTSVPPMSPNEIPFNYLNVFTRNIAAAVRLKTMDEACKKIDLRDALGKTAHRNNIQFKGSDAQLVIVAVIFAADKEVKGAYRRLYLDFIPPYGDNKDILICTAHAFGYASNFDEKEIHMGKSFGALARLLVNSVLLIKHQPSLVSVEKSVGSGIGFSNKLSDEPMPVRWLGKNFFNDRTASRPGGGTHASPRAHWRRGHWHGYRYGEGRKALKRKWVQPVYVNPQ